jgi:hypothetical protein
MTLAIQFLLALQLAIGALVFAQALRDQAVFSLRSVLTISLVMYVSVPIFLCLPHHNVLVNSALLPVDPWALLSAALAGVMMALMILIIPNPHLARPRADEPVAWVSVLFALLFAINLWALVSFVRAFDMELAIAALLGGTGARIRDLAYDTLTDTDTGLGYVTKVLNIAVFGWLWMNSSVKTRWLIFGVLPVVALDVISLGRHTVASFVVVLFFVLERRFSRRALYVVAPAVVGLIFFFRIIVFSFTDPRYDEWAQSAFTASSEGVEALGEFFNTFGTFLMIESIPAARFTWDEILSMVASQGVLPPGTGGLWHGLTSSEFPLFRISELMKMTYGPHPAHLSIADIYTFGLVSVLGLIGYFATAWWAARSRRVEAGIVYLYLIGLFYLPFRGSLTLNALRFVWLIVALMAIGELGRFIQRRWVNRSHQAAPLEGLA